MERNGIMQIIAISREFGSGGRELGKRIADLLGFKYYDKALAPQIAAYAKYWLGTDKNENTTIRSFYIS